MRILFSHIEAVDAIKVSSVVALRKQDRLPIFVTQLAAPRLRGFDDENRRPKPSPVGRADNGEFRAFYVDLEEVNLTVRCVRGDEVVERVARHPYLFNR